ncbi:hypothetical protein FO519_008998 [Halicephalobus sp. NKZ332]|nr:hypothetical protein FO519_008998 [Halicephalobus sp. NKZ332]
MGPLQLLDDGYAMKPYVSIYFFVFSLFIPTIFGVTFVQLIGYSVFSDWSYVGNITENTPEACAEQCLTQRGDNCTAFYYKASPKLCIFYRQVDNIISNPTTCSYYIIDKRNSTQERPDLNSTDQLIYALAYKNPTDLCRWMWQPNGTLCTYQPATGNCNTSNYAAFFGVFVNASNPGWCLMEQRQPYLCPVKTWIGWTHAAEGIGYCYPNVTVASGQSADYYIQTCRNVTSNTDMISIHSTGENSFINTNIGPTMLGLYIPGSTWSATNFVWSDGTSLDFVNWDSSTSQPDNANGNEFFTSMLSTGYWQDQQTFDDTLLVCKTIVYSYTYL